MLRHLKRTRHFVPKPCRRFYSKGFYVLLPETPKGAFVTPETNELLDTTKVPSSFKIDVQKCRDAIGIASLNFESKVWKAEMLLKDPTYTTEQLMADLDASELEYTMSLLSIIHIINHLPNVIFERLLQRAEIAKNLKYSSRPLYFACKELLADNPRNTDLKVHAYVGKLNGVELTEKSRELVKALQKDLAKHMSEFNANVNQSNSSFKHLIADEAHLGDMSLADVTAIAKDKSNPKRGPWVLTLNKQCYNSFLENSPLPPLRWNIWQAYNHRATATGNNNSSLIEKIRQGRRRVAKELGFANNAELQVQPKASGSVHNVKSMIATLLVKCMPEQRKENERLTKFAHSQGYDMVLKPWDVPYWRKKERENLFGIQDVKFQYEETLASLLDFTSTIFPIEYEKVQENHYKIHSKTSSKGLMGQFVIDPFRSANKFPGSYHIRNNLFTTLITNFDPPMYGEPARLSQQDLTVLFETFGHVLQKCFASSDADVGKDFRIPGHFLTFWLSNRNFVEKYLKLSGDKLENFIKARQHFSATDACHELYLSDLDLELDLSEDFWLDLVKKMWPTYNVVDLEKSQHLCSSALIHYSSQYYCDLWSRMLAADCYRAFVEYKEPKDSNVTGARFYKSFLDPEERSHPSEKFRSFRGRDPSPDALLWSLGLHKMEKADK